MICFDSFTARTNSASVIRLDSSVAIPANLSRSVSVADFVLTRAVAIGGTSFLGILLTIVYLFVRRGGNVYCFLRDTQGVTLSSHWSVPVLARFWPAQVCALSHPMAVRAS